jgi:hypothetical protein
MTVTISACAVAEASTKDEIKERAIRHCREAKNFLVAIIESPETRSR